MYLVKSGYYCANAMVRNNMHNASTSASSDKHLWKFIWGFPILKKIKTFLWRLCHNAISIRDNLYKKKIVNSPLCLICHQDKEAIEHAFLLYPWTMPV